MIEWDLGLAAPPHTAHFTSSPAPDPFPDTFKERRERECCHTLSHLSRIPSWSTIDRLVTACAYRRRPFLPLRDLTVQHAAIARPRLGPQVSLRGAGMLGFLRQACPPA